MTTTNQSIDLYLKFYQEHTNQWRHYETQRAAVAGSILAIAAALVGLVTLDKVINRSDLPLTILITFLGILGVFFSTKQHERASMHIERARHYRSAIDAMLEDLPLSKIKMAADKVHAAKFRKLDWIKTNKLWLLLYSFLAGIGITLSAIALWTPQIAA